MSDTAADPIPGDPLARDAWNVTRRLMTILYAAGMVLAAGGLVFIWNIWEPVYGSSVQNLATYAILMAAALVTAGWLIIFSPFRWRTVAFAVGGIGLVAVAVAASIRKYEYTGDMGLAIEYRWDPTPQERLAEHLKQSASQRVATVSEAPTVAVEDMPGYLGADRDGHIIGPELSQDWELAQPRLLWSQPCGGGYSSFAVVGDFVVTLEQRGTDEVVVCYDQSTGAERWTYSYPALFEEAMGGPGPRATPTIADGDVYSLGAEGDLVCLALISGEKRWHVDSLPPGAANVTWALSSSPLVHENSVIVEAGGPKGDGLIAYERSSGDVLWQRPGVEKLTEANAENHAGYSSPTIFTIHDVQQVLIFDGEGLRSHVPETGDQLWFHEFQNGPKVNVAQPIVFDDGRVFLSQSYGVGCRMIDVQHTNGEWSTTELWSNLNMKCKFASPILHDGYLYGLDEGILVCLDPNTGERRWKKGRYGHGQILLTNGQIVVLSETGDVVLVDADPEQFREISRFAALDHPKVWNAPALANGIIYVRNHESMAAFDLRVR